MITIKVVSYTVKRVHIENGSLVGIIFLHTLKHMKFEANGIEKF